MRLHFSFLFEVQYYSVRTMAAQLPQVTSTFILYQKSYVQQINILTYLHLFLFTS